MKVYSLMGVIQWEGHTLLGTFSSVEKLDQFVKSRCEIWGASPSNEDQFPMDIASIFGYEALYVFEYDLDASFSQTKNLIKSI